MQLEDYFLFEKFPSKFGEVERIRIRGHRIAIQNMLEHYKAGKSAEQIQSEVYPSLTLEEVYATITYYLHNQQVVEAYIERAAKIGDAYYEEWLRQEPSEAVTRLRALSDNPDEARRLQELRARQVKDGKASS
jgi:uncharacterized protein (DUF433 family)